MLVNFVLAGLKITAGVFGGSKAILADGFHSLFDLVADLFVMISIQVSNRPSDQLHPYGYKRYETLGNIVISIVLILIACGIGVDAVFGSVMAQKVNYHLVLPIALVAIIINEVAYQFVSHYARLLSSDLLSSLAVHQRSDAATSSVVLMSGLTSMMGFVFSDQFATLLIACMILYYAIPSTLKSITELLDKGLSDQELIEIESTIASVEGVIDFHLLRSRKMASLGILDVHIVVDPWVSVSEGHYISDMVEKRLRVLPNIEDITVHVDFYNDHDLKHAVLPSREEVYAFFEGRTVIGIHFNTQYFIIHYHVDRLSVFLCVASKDVLAITDAVENISKPKWLKVVKVLEIK
ncbi:cation diffusion facilitator family transporter [Gammaproteobacteria bacterium]|nr:cation diffusion facilitator family transporter [Gammaproteobacteria bacterium]